LTLDTHELRHRPGAERTVQVTVPAPAGLATAVIGVPESEPLELNLRLECVSDGVLVTGTVSGHGAGECVRCLDEVEIEIDADVQELYLFPELRKLHGNDDEDLCELEGDLLDLEPAIRDAVVSTLPFAPLCGLDCPGLCAVCGVHLADEPGHAHDVIDPRWSALEELFDKMKES
jgi:uncharacterized protein